MKYLITIIVTGLCFIYSHGTIAQVIVNIEQKRIVTDTLGWAGSANLGFQLNKNTERQLALSSSAHLQYKSAKSLYLLLGNVSFVEAGDEQYVNAGFAHFRHNRKFGKVVRSEAFAQYQYNTILQVDQRILLGAGPRLKLLSSEKFTLYQGTLYMYEHEEIITPQATHDNHRLSVYVSSSWQPTKSTSLSSTWYFQPLLSDWKDHRTSGRISLSVSMTEKLDFTTSFNYLRDSRPPAGVPKEVYSMSNGLSYKF